MQKVAVIGRANVFPGATTPEEFWQKLLDKVDCRSEATVAQMGDDPNRFYQSKKGGADWFYCKMGGYIRDFQLDPEGFKLPAKFIDGLDDLFKWSLHASREALSDAGYLENQSVLEGAGVVLGNLSFPTKLSNHLFMPIYRKVIENSIRELISKPDFTLKDHTDIQDVNPYNGFIAGYPSAIIAQALGLHGVNFSLDAACASSVYSVKLACDYLNTGKQDLMLAGAVSGGDPLFVNLGFSIFQAYPENGVHAPFSKNSGGLFAGEGAGILVLKRYDEAVRDGDHIHAVICGAGLSNDGKGQHVLSPNTKGQVKAYERAYQDAGVDPKTIDFIECHATGTPLGDKVELTSMETFFCGQGTSPYIGSVKSNLGHLLTAAGMPGMMKTMLAMEHGQIPATINVENVITSPGGEINKDNIVSETIDWPQKGDQGSAGDLARRAGVSVFGFGGSNAHLVMEQNSEALQKEALKQTASKPTKKESMAIIGMDALFGGCEGLSSFHDVIYSGKQNFIELPEKRWEGIDQDADLLAELGVKGSELPKGAYLEEFDFNFMHFRVPPNEDDRLIPQQLITMKVADRALTEAGIEVGTNVAVLVAMGVELELHRIRARVNMPAQIEDTLANGNIELTEEQRVELERISKDSIHAAAKLNQYTSAIGNIMASRISSLWDFSGPSITVSAEENSVARCLDIAENLLLTSDVEAVVVAAVDLAGSAESVLLRNALSGWNSKKTSLSFDSEVDGWNPGEGAGAVVLKRLKDAKASNNTVYATIEGIGSALGSDVGAVTLSAERALSNAGLSAADVGYVEAHASGLTTQDEVELAGLRKIYGSDGSEKHVAIGSVKANIGHTFSASGIAGLIKSALCLHYRFIPGVPQWQSPKMPELWQDSSLYVQSDSKAWFAEDDKAPRVAAMSSLGVDGCSTHVILSEHLDAAEKNSDYLTESDVNLIPVNGNSVEEILAGLVDIKTAAEKGKTLFEIGQEHYEKTSEAKTALSFSIVASTTKELLMELKGAEVGIPNSVSTGKEWLSPRGSYFTPKPLGVDGKVTYVYPGGFSSYIGVGKDLFQLFPELHDSMQKHTSRMGAMLGDILFYPRSVDKLSDDELKQRSKALVHTPISMFESGICYATIFTEIMRGQFGLKADSAIGYSMGEISMMYALGVWDSSDEMSRILNTDPVFRTRLAGPMETVREAWSINSSVPDKDVWDGYILKANVDVVRKAIAGEDKVFLILINTTDEVVIAGNPADCIRIAESLKCEYFWAHLSDVIHCSLVRTDYAALANLHRMPVNKVEDVKLLSAVGYKIVDVDSEGIANNIAEMYCNPVDFPKLINTAYDDGSRIFVELGPRDSCSQYVRETLKGREHLSMAINRRGTDDKTSLVKLLATLNSHKVDIDLAPLYKQYRSVEPKKKGLVKPIKLGGETLQEIILNETSKAIFTSVKAGSNATPITVSQLNLRKNSYTPFVIPSMSQETEEGQVSATGANTVTQLTTNTQVLEQQSIQNQTVSAAGGSRRKPAFGGVNQTAASSINSFQPADVENNKLMKNIKDNSQAIASFGEGSPQYEKYKDNMSRVGQAHAAFLESRQEALEKVGELIQLQAQAAAGGGIPATLPVVGETRRFPETKLVENFSKPQNIIWDTDALVEFAEGDIGKVFGSDYDIIDTYSRRVRLPTTDYLLVSRVTELDAKMNEYRPSSMTTEYDIPLDAPYLIDGQIPWSVAVESGQCDLLLISYIGIDFANKGDRVYRLLDCTMTFLGEIPKGGQTLRYEIKIDSYARNGDALLFFFHYDCFVGDEKILIMRGGVAGFFTDKELEEGKGVIPTKDDIAQRENAVKQSFQPLLNCSRTQFEIDDMKKLISGDIAGCFGPDYDQKGYNPSLLFSSEKFLMIERVTQVDLTGGAWGLGYLVGEKQLEPDHWYFPCHFKDDQVLAGSLNSEGCCQLLQFYMMHIGLQAKTKNARFQPLPHGDQKVRCRGQVLPQSAVLEYRLEVIEVGTDPYPFARANVDILLNGKVVVDFKNVGAILKEQDDAELAAPATPVAAVAAPVVAPIADVTTDISPTAPLMQVEPDMSAAEIMGVQPIKHIPAPPIPNDNRVPDTVPYQPYHMFEFATGDISQCFGSEFDFYRGITPPRTPCGELQLTTRITEVRGKRGDLKNPAYCKGEYEVPSDEWYYRKNSHPSVMPYSVMMEISLQPNGFVSAWAGTTLRFPGLELFFRNLDGEGTLLRHVDLRGKTIVNDSNLLSTVVAGTNIIQSFDFTLSTDNEPFYRGTAVFGYFIADALKDQLGLDKGQVTNPWHVDHKTPSDKIEKINLLEAPTRSQFCDAKAAKPYYHLAGGQLNFIDRIEIVQDGGKAGKGYLYAERTIDPKDWFFQFHFHQDPVMPGSLGVEAIIETMQVYALQNDLGANLKNPQFDQILSTIKWRYRGQINPENKKMNLDVHITDVIHEAGRVTIIGDANLSKDGLRIYEVMDIAICLREAD